LRTLSASSRSVGRSFDEFASLLIDLIEIGNGNGNSSSSSNTMNGITLEGLGGLSHGSIFRVSDSVNTSKPPGTSLPETPPETLSETTFNILTGEAFCYSPNLSWFLMTVGAWCVFPYDLEEQESSSNATTSLLKIVSNRLVINHALALAYIGFWHWALYFQDLCHRPYVPNRIYSFPKVSHNVFYTVLGILQWTLVEGAFVHLYRSGKLQYVDATQNPTALLQTLVLSILLPSYRDVHFYFAHRLIHLRPLYKYIHSLHHRNSDTEPFSGLAMHPVEHMYYFTCYGPLLVLPLILGFVVSPFLVFWMGTHCVITPAASHSGYEDHFSADLPHYLHHRYFECNYSGGINFDAFFGTYKATLAEAKKPIGNPDGSNTNTNTITESSTGKHASQSLSPPPRDPKSSLGFPEHPDYELGLCILVLWALCANHSGGASPLSVALVVSLGPVALALFLALQSVPKHFSTKRTCLAPFDKDSASSLGLHLGLGVLLGVLPATHLLVLFLEDND
jgi:sterol desaturase/sphingolipid hydroxylase (fatty acid hydroxylase superfamily)